jgi:hypothetical protein
MREFDYYIFIDYSVDIIGYAILEKDKLKKLFPRILRFRHYREARDQKLYIKHIKSTLERDSIKSYFLKIKLKEMYRNIEIYLDVLEFLKKHENCIIFISIDNHEFSNFNKMVNIADGKNVMVKQESELKKGTLEYQASLVLDNILNIERLRRKHE